MTLACDYAWSHPSPAAIKAAGYDVALRYLSPDPSKNLSRSESMALLNARVAIGLVWESTANRAVDGAAAGTDDGRAAAAQAAALGYPPGCPLLANLGDFAATYSQIPAIDAYYLAFCVATAQWAHGGYATGYIIDNLVARGCQGIWWENAMNDGGEFGWHISPSAWIYQRTIHTFEMAGTPGGWWDENVILKPIPFWGTSPVPVPPAPLPTPTPTPIEEDPVGFILAATGSPTIWIVQGKVILLKDTPSVAAVEQLGATVYQVPGTLITAALAAA